MINFVPKPTQVIKTEEDEEDDDELEEPFSTPPPTPPGINRKDNDHASTLNLEAAGELPDREEIYNSIFKGKNI